MSNMALELALEKAGVELLRAKVGDRYVLQGLEEKAGRLVASHQVIS